MTAPDPAGPLAVSLLTPEQVPLRFELAPAAARLLALLADLALLGAALVLVGLLAAFAGLGDGWAAAVATLAFFVLFNFYFVLFELHGQGRTPGKRWAGLRVVARDGGPLTVGLVAARNLTRNVELWLPLAVLFGGEGLVAVESPWLRLGTLVWIGALVVLPLFNRHRARLGDLVAGTLVVAAPRPALLPDLAAAGAGPPAPPGAAAAPAEPGAAPAGPAFTDEQLDIYGIHELHVLEEVLRRPPEQRDPEVLALIAEKVARKIRWPGGPPADPEAFLRAFYAAQRRRLEHDLLFGRRRERKRR